MTIADIKKNTEGKMEQSIAAYKNNLSLIHILTLPTKRIV